MNTLSDLKNSPTHLSVLTRNMSSPKLTRVAAIVPNRWESPTNTSFAGLQELKQEQFYIEKLRAQRERVIDWWSLDGISQSRISKER
jgi:hypothetical protein